MVRNYLGTADKLICYLFINKNDLKIINCLIPSISIYWDFGIKQISFNHSFRWTIIRGTHSYLLSGQFLLTPENLILELGFKIIPHPRERITEVIQITAHNHHMSQHVPSVVWRQLNW